MSFRKDEKAWRESLKEGSPVVIARWRSPISDETVASVSPKRFKVGTRTFLKKDGSEYGSNGGWDPQCRVALDPGGTEVKSRREAQRRSKIQESERQKCIVLRRDISNALVTASPARLEALHAEICGGKP